jgi:archaellum biogenesis ATPase FlaH
MMPRKRKDMHKKKRKWIIDGLFPEGHLILVVGQPGNGKSWWMAQLAVDAAVGGQHICEFDIQQCSVIYIDEDTPTDTYEERLDRIAEFVNKTIQQLPIDCRSMSGFRLYDNKIRQALVDDIEVLNKNGKRVLLIIDCLGKVMAGGELDTTAQATKVMSYLTELRGAGATVIVTHHISLKRQVDLDIWDKMSLVMNSTALVSNCDTAFVVSRVQIRKPTMFVIYPVERRLSLKHDEPFAVELFEDDEQSVAYLLKIDEIPSVPSDNAKKLFKLFTDSATELTVRVIDQHLHRDLSERDIRNGLKELVAKQCLQWAEDRHSSHRYHYKLHCDFAKLDTFYKKELIKN